MIREIPQHLLDDWLDNWSRWCVGDNPPTINVSDACDMYESPERNHHEPPRAVRIRLIIAYDAAITLEQAIVAEGFPQPGRAALRATYVAFTEDERRRLHMKLHRWDAMRARAAGLARSDYHDALHAAKQRLARVLYPSAHLIRRAA